MSDKPIAEEPIPADSHNAATPAVTGQHGTETTATVPSPDAVAGNAVTGTGTTESGKSANDPAIKPIVPDSGVSSDAGSDPQVGGGATSSGTQSTAVLTKTTAPEPDAASPAAQRPADSVPFATLLAASRTTAHPGPDVARAAAWSTMSPVIAMPPPLPPVPPRWQRVARPPGVLPAAALAGIAGATVIPLDRPGIGWLITGVAITGALCAVDYRARSRGTPEKSPSDSAPTAGGLPATAPPAVVPTTADGPGAKPVEQLSPSASDGLATPNTEGASPAAEGTESGRTVDTGTGDDAAPAKAATSDGSTPVDRPADPTDDRPTVEVGAADNGVKSARTTAKTADSSAAGEEPSAATAPATDRATPSNEAATHSVSIGDRAWWATAAIVLLGVGTVRAAGWLFVLCVIAACVAGSLAVLGRRSVRGIVHDMFAVPLASFGAVPWAFSGLRESRSAGTAGVRRYGVSVAATAALLVVFVPLLGGADATFAKLLNGLVPTVDGPAAWQWIFLFAVVTVGVLGALYLLAGPPAHAADSVRPVRLWSRSEWMLPVGALTVLFAVFVGAQFVALFGGDDYVQRTAGLTYAEYARSGFWQLSAVSILTLAVILAVLHWSGQETAADRRSLRVLLSAVSVLALVIVCSALGRMWTYQQAYGFTVLRLLVTTCELWVGLVYVLVLIAIARLRWSWVPRAAIGTALGTLVALALLNPEHLVAERNIDRWQTSGRLDADYLSTLSPDILPALDPLPHHLRTQIETPVLDDLDDDQWWSWNWSRSSAR
ncbi:DUF4173 domain-containing protein [Nocardia sp. PE-7]|uniref:DUF4153 domain-containing protein n=1 Tax=Nocardia sp. PE-7 TaxID=3058426 RepID=UPI002658C8E5|nr:DUF4153 domain-containing protein [Nocardia sp. PE-7]WKG07227.1 DUF4173 domain-containing protein [Nocardia sp. PE-7]